MKRIGIAASRISKGNLFLYNFYVILISALFSLSIFLVAGATVVLALMVIKYAGTAILGAEFAVGWGMIMTVCMVLLTTVITLFNLAAILINIKMPKLRG